MQDLEHAFQIDIQALQLFPSQLPAFPLSL